MLLFSKYAQAFYLLDRKTGLTEDELNLKNIEGLVAGKYSFRLLNQKFQKILRIYGLHS